MTVAVAHHDDQGTLAGASQERALDALPGPDGGDRDVRIERLERWSEPPRDLARRDAGVRAELHDARAPARRRERASHAQRAPGRGAADLAIHRTRRSGRCSAETGRPVRRLGNAHLVEPAVSDGARDGGVHVVEHRLVLPPAEAQQVRAGGQGGHRGLADRPRAARPLHVQGVGDDGSPEAQLAAEQPHEHPPAHGGRSIVEGGQHDVGRHHRVHPGGDDVPEGRQLPLPEDLDRLAHDGQVHVGVLGGVPMAREVLRARGHPRGVQPPDERGAVATDEPRGGAERAHADHRVGRVAVDVDARREVEGDTGRGQLGADGRRHRVGERFVVHGPERGVARIGAAGRHLQARDVAALLVRSHDRSASGRPQGRRQLGDAAGVGDVVAEEADATEATLQATQQPGRRVRTAERREQAAVDHGVEVHVSP
jgi:hypothetical protein